jgi:hypothetical protein
VWRLFDVVPPPRYPADDLPNQPAATRHAAAPRIHLLKRRLVGLVDLLARLNVEHNGSSHIAFLDDQPVEASEYGVLQKALLRARHLDLCFHDPGLDPSVLGIDRISILAGKDRLGQGRGVIGTVGVRKVDVELVRVVVGKVAERRRVVDFVNELRDRG